MTFLRNAWYVAAHAHELNEGLVARVICAEQIVLFRTESGEVAALKDRCPHRFVPLSMGKRVGDSVECGYHGLRFGKDGSCIEAPNDDEAQRARICVRAYAAVERHGFVWMWLGEPAAADPSLIPDFSVLDQPGYAHSSIYTHIKGNYQLIADNLLDLSHIHFLHPDVHQGSSFADFTNKLKIEGDTVYSMLWRHHYHLDPQRQAMFGIPSDDAEGQGHARWTAPGNLLVDTAFWAHGKSYDDGVQMPNAHMITPETEWTSHYFWASVRNYMQDHEQMTRGIEATTKNIFDTQDGPMVEAQQAAMGTSDKFLDMKPIILRADAAGLAARRILKRKIDAENRVPAEPEAVAAE